MCRIYLHPAFLKREINAKDVLLSFKTLQIKVEATKMKSQTDQNCMVHLRMAATMRQDEAAFGTRVTTAQFIFHIFLPHS